MVKYEIYGTVYEKAYLTEQPISMAIGYSPNEKMAKNFYSDEMSDVETHLNKHKEYTWKIIGEKEDRQKPKEKKIKRKKD